jgi:regulatory protein
LTPGDAPTPPPADAPTPARPEALRLTRAAAFRLLARRDRSRSELQSRLAARFPADLADRVVDELTQAGYLDDARLAKRLAERLADERGFGPARVRHELLRRGLPPEAAPPPDPEAVRAAALQAARRYLADRAPDDRTLRRLAGHLERRGFPAADIRAIVRGSREGRLWDDV